TLELPSYFNPTPLLEVIVEIQPDIFPDPTKNSRIVMEGIEALIHCDIDRESFEWLKIFPIAQHIDPTYKFIDSISFNNNVKYTKQFFNKLDMVIPYIDSIRNESVYVKISKVIF